MDNKIVTERIIENARLVNYILQKYFNKHMTYLHKEELIQLGHIGLWKAAKDFDESKGFKFSTYACRKIWGEVARYLKSFYGRDEGIKGVKKRENGYIIVDITEYNYSNNACFTSKQNNFVEEVINKYDYEKALKSINEREKEILELYYFKEYSQTQISKIYNISQIQVSRILRKAREKMRKELMVI